MATQLPHTADTPIHWTHPYGCGTAHAIAQLLKQHKTPVLLLVADSGALHQMEQELQFFCDEHIPIIAFPDLETLPYDRLSPHKNIIAERLSTLVRLRHMQHGVCIASAASVMQRLAPAEFIDKNTFVLQRGDTLDMTPFQRCLSENGYSKVSQVFNHGEYAVRGSVIDFFPAGNDEPVRIDLWDDEIESLRSFSPLSQLSKQTLEQVTVLPSQEYPFDKAAIERFRTQFRAEFEQRPDECPIYRDISNGILPDGVEAYLPLFFEQTSNIFEYIAEQSLIVFDEDTKEYLTRHWQYIDHRREQLKDSPHYPTLEADRLYHAPEEVLGYIETFKRIQIAAFDDHPHPTGDYVGTTAPEHSSSNHASHTSDNPRVSPTVARRTSSNHAYSTGDNPRVSPTVTRRTSSNHASHTSGALSYQILPPVALNMGLQEPTMYLRQFIADFDGRILFTAQSSGYRQHILDLLTDLKQIPHIVDNWNAFHRCKDRLCICVGELHEGVVIKQHGKSNTALIPDHKILGRHVAKQRSQSHHTQRSDAIIKSIDQLEVGHPVVHEKHGVGRFLGLETADIHGEKSEFCVIEYANHDKLYVPITAIHLLSRYATGDAENAPLHTLGASQWDAVKRKAAQKAYDVAAEILDTQARRQNLQGVPFAFNESEYHLFASSFPYEETADQEKAVEEIWDDMRLPKPMDRVVCGDVGFGKTEVAMRAMFIAVNSGYQVAVLTPTTLLARQHLETFQNRFSDWAVRIEMLSRLHTSKSQKHIIHGIEQGVVDIVVGTHKLLKAKIHFKNLALIVIDEEHRFGVKDKEKIKMHYAKADVLMLTATPIPRTLSMSLNKLRDITLISTPPANRYAIKTFIKQWDDALIREACQREILRGGQVFFVHNRIETIEKMAEHLKKLLPHARFAIAHGAMHEYQLESAMLDFYNQKSDILVCTTIIENGIDIPTANTMIIDRADRFGLSQLHQLRGRIGRSHHSAYAYLLIPPKTSLTPNAIKRLEAIESLKDLGAGWVLAQHDLEIRGAGELLGKEQSGHIHEVGFAMYNKLLKHAVEIIQSDKAFDIDKPLDTVTEVDLGEPAFIPHDYLPDINLRLILYRKISHLQDIRALKDLTYQLEDRFGKLPDYLHNLLKCAELRIQCHKIGITEVKRTAAGLRIGFDAGMKVDADTLISIVSSHADQYQLSGNQSLLLRIAEDETTHPSKKLTHFIEQICHNQQLPAHAKK